MQIRMGECGRRMADGGRRTADGRQRITIFTKYIKKKHLQCEMISCKCK